MTNPILRPKKKTVIRYNADNGKYFVSDFDNEDENLETQPQFKTTGDIISEEDARAAVGDARLDKVRMLANQPANKGKSVAISTVNSTATPEENRISEAQRLYPGRMKMQADTDELIRQIKAAMTRPGGGLMRSDYE